MKVLVIYRPNSEQARSVEEFIREFERRHDQGYRLEVISIDSRDGSATASLYDILQHPAILVLADNGSVQQSWVGDSLPRIDDVVAYARA
ncbi:MAG: hypothetical protein U0524_03500 [Candidatus Saccharimonadales bacterium]